MDLETIQLLCQYRKAPKRCLRVHNLIKKTTSLGDPCKTSFSTWPLFMMLFLTLNKFGMVDYPWSFCTG